MGDDEDDDVVVMRRDVEAESVTRPFMDALTASGSLPSLLAVLRIDDVVETDD